MFYPATIAGHANQVVMSRPFDDAIRQKIIINPDIVVHKDQDVVVLGRREARFVYLGQPETIAERDLCRESIIMGQSLQGLAEHRGFPERVFRQWVALTIVITPPAPPESVPIPR